MATTAPTSGPPGAGLRQGQANGPGTPAALPFGLGATFWSVWRDLPSAGGAGASGTHRGSSVAGVAESFGEGETWIGGWDGVGLYEGNNKVPGYQNMWVHITTHRLLLVPETEAFAALQAPMSAVRQTEFYTGFMRSSPKITLTLGWAAKAVAEPTSVAANPGATDAISTPSPVFASAAAATATALTSARSSPAPEAAAATWTCGVCGFANALPHGTIVSPSSKCQLCGVAYATSRTMSPPPSRPASASPSLQPPFQRAGTPASTSTASQLSRSASQVVSSPVSMGAERGEPEPQPQEADAGDEEQIACPACTFLNHASMTECEICGTALPKRLPRRREPSKQAAPATSTPTPSAATVSGPKPDASARENDTVRLSFRKGGEREAYKRLKGVLSDKVWERVAAPKPRAERSGAGGIEAIMRNISLENKAHDAGMQDAFRDLEVLMVRAGEMVRLAQSLNAKMTAAGETNEDEATLVRSSLVQLGLPAPALTQDMVRDERAYLDGLARELGHLLTGPRRAIGDPVYASTSTSSSSPSSSSSGLMLQTGRGVVALDTVWGLWMRARGVALLPPATLMQLLPLLPPHTNPPIRLLTLPSGLQVLYSPLYAPGQLARRLVRRMAPPDVLGEGEAQGPGAQGGEEGRDGDEGDGAEEAAAGEVGMSIIDIAAVEGLPIGLATELVDMITARGTGSGAGTGATSMEMGIVRDEQARPSDGGVRFYRDLIAEWPLGLVQ